MKSNIDAGMKVLQIISWIIFIGVCIEAGGFIFNTFFTLVLTPVGAKNFWKQIDLSALYDYNQSHFVTITSIMIIVSVLRAIMFYMIVKIFHDKILNLSQPFNETIRIFILKIAYLALGIGLFAYWGTKFTKGLMQDGVQMPDLQSLRLGGADVWLFMGVTLLVIAQIFKKGIEIQNENDLTV